jgi:hypothetical protein
MKLHTKEKPFYSVSFSHIHTGRSTDAKNFDLLRDAKEFLAQVNGYLIRHETGKAKVLGFNNFQPSATEGRRIEGILNCWNG